MGLHETLKARRPCRQFDWRNDELVADVRGSETVTRRQLMQERAVQTSSQERYHEDSDTLLQLSGTEYGHYRNTGIIIIIIRFGLL